MFFEGSEKKFEIQVKGVDLLSWPKEYWSELVSKSEAQILSEISNDYCKAYLLSESSLFVWKDRLTMITCGQTSLINALNFLMEKFKKEDIEFLIFERKNEYFPREQSSHFYDDVKKLKALKLEGPALRFGPADEHHLYLYHLDTCYRSDENDMTLELLMYDLAPEKIKLFQKRGLKSEELRKQSGIENILSGFQIDDFVFEPYGYSLNAIKKDKYFTIHVTPQELGCYVSFETNITCDQMYKTVVSNVLEVFKPRAFDMVTFANCDLDFLPAQSLTAVPYALRRRVQKELSCGYNVNYSTYISDINKIEKPHVLKDVEL